jgi:outer membrane protein OmpA-like peptidoglycan-associated protein
MNKNRRLAGLIVAGAIFGLSSCASSRPPLDQRNSKQAGYFLDHENTVRLGGVGNYHRRATEVTDHAKTTKESKKVTLLDLSATPQFELDSAELKPEAIADLEKISRQLAAQPDRKIRIVGHADDTGGPDYNLKLSEARAESVRKVLLKNGLQENQLEIRAQGETRPIADNESESGRARNRRVELQQLG